MRLWKTLAILGLAFGLGGVGWGYARQRNAVGFFELRIYTTKPGKRNALAARFGDYTTRDCGRQTRHHQCRLLVRRLERKRSGSQRRTHVRLHARLPIATGSRRALQSAHDDDPEFVRIVLDAEGNPQTALIEKTQQIHLVPTNYSAISGHEVAVPRRAMCSTIVVGVWLSAGTATAQASDPWIGTWRLNVARSSFNPGPPPRVQTIDIPVGEGDGLYVVTNGVDAAGRPTHTERLAKFDGRDYPAQGFEQPTTQALPALTTAVMRSSAKPEVGSSPGRG